jgi:hypothetical protein
MKLTASAIVAAAMLAAPAANAATVQVGQSDAPWLGFMNVFELPANGGGFVFGNGWGIGDLVANFDDGANTLTMSPNTIGDPNEFWYQDPTGSGNTSPGGPGAPGNKIMEANLFQEITGGALNGITVTFEGVISSNSFTGAHEASIFIRDFASDFSSFNETRVAADAGAFSISLDTIADSTRVVQWGFQVSGVNVWVTDTAPFGNMVIRTIPTPGALAVLGLGGLVATRRRRA